MNNILFAQFEKNFSTNEPSWLKLLRQNAWSQFGKIGFPTTQNENWKYTSLKPLKETAFKLADFNSDLSSSTKFQLENFIFENKNNARLTFVNGFFAPHLSSVQYLPKDVKIGSLEEALKTTPELVEPYLSKSTDFNQQPFVALNSSFLREGAFLYIPKNNLIRNSIELVFLTNSSQEPIFSHPRNLIVIEEGSEVSIIENYASLNSHLYFTNAVTEIVLKEKATLSHYKIQRESEAAFHISNLHVHQEAKSKFNSHSISLGGKLVRNDLTTTLNAEGSECLLNGLYLGKNSQHIDTQTTIDHLKPHCSSTEFYKGILDQQAESVFNGKIIVRPNASKTVARQMNKNLLLSKEAIINTKPLLEIYNNDVKCNHGATIGRLDENQLFYLRSRGIDESYSKQLLTYAFASDLVEQIKISNLRNKLKDTLFALLMNSKEAA